MSIKNRRKRKSPFARFGDMPEEPVKKKSATNGKNSQKKGKGKTECFSLLKTKKIPKEDKTPIGIRRNDELIDLSPCVGIYQEAVFFGDYNINKELLLRKLLNPGLASVVPRDATLDEKILYLTFFETRQQRYVTQVKESLATPAQARQIKRRLSENLSPNDEVQCYCEIPFAKEKNGSCEFYAIGFADAVKNETVCQ